MKKLYFAFLLLTCIRLSAQQNRNPNDYYYNSLRLGLHLGASWQTSDVRSTPGGAWGLSLEQGMLENKNNIFSLALRLRYLGANTYGLDYRRNYDLKNNPALNGSYNSATNYAADTAGGSKAFIYNNYKMGYNEGALELQINFNRLRERTGILLGFWGGVGITAFTTKMDLLDAGGNKYNFSSVDSSQTPSALTAIKLMLDKKYESSAEGSKGSTVIAFAPSCGMSFGYQFNNRVSLSAEYKLTFPQGAYADLLDGRRGVNHDWLAGSNDYYHYAGLHLSIRLNGGHDKREDPTTTYQDPPTPITNTPTPTNSVVSNPTPTPSVTPTPTVIPVEQVPPPVVNFINPPSTPYNVTNPQFQVRAQVLNVTKASQIQLSMNGQTTTNFSYDAYSKQLSFNTTLSPGTNYVRVWASNQGGSDSKSATIILEQPEPAGLPPVVTITNPAYSPYQSNVNTFTFRAQVTNVAQQGNITVTYNGQPTNAFNYNAQTQQLELPVSLQPGNNVVVIAATNNFGNDSKNAVVVYKEERQTLPPPVITFVAPAQSPYTSTVPNYNVQAQVLNVTAQNQVTVTANGQVVPFSFNLSTLQLSLSMNLVSGTNYVNIQANNGFGADSETASIIYNIREEHPAPVVTITNPAASPSSTNQQNYTFKATVLNVNSKADIQVSLNGIAQNNFTYNPFTKGVILMAPLMQGANTLIVTGTNLYGNDTKSTVVDYQQIAVPKLPPVITFVAPAQSPYTNAFNTYTYRATVQNVPNASMLLVKYNGQIITNYAYDGLSLNFPATLQNGNNILEIVATNNDGTDSKNANVIYQPRVVANPPVVSFINPLQSPYTVNTASYNVLAQVLNVSGQSQITVNVNGQNVPFTYNAATFQVSFVANLQAGNNTVNVSGTNASGTDQKTTTIVYQRRATPPVVSFMSPATSPFNSLFTSYTFQANIQNISSAAQLSVRYNGAVVTNFTFNGTILSFPVGNLQAGNNILEITATNNDGTDTKNANVVFQQKAEPAPVVSFINPAQSPYTVNAASYNVLAQVLNVSGQSQITVNVNGQNVPFTYNPATFQVSFVANLQAGNNTVNVSGTNASGTDQKTTTILYQRRATPPVVSFMSPATSPFNSLFTSYTFQANIQNISSAAQLSVRYNGAVVTNFSFNGTILSFPVGNLQAGNNILEITATNNDGTDTKNANVVFQQKVEPAPVVSFITPAQSPSNVSTNMTNITAQVLNVSTQSQIVVTANGQNIAFNFNSINHQVNFAMSLQQGNNTVNISATNPGGSDAKSTVINYSPAQRPIVTITQPTAAQTMTDQPQYVFKANVLHVNSQADIQVSLNGVTMNNFTYNSFSKEVNLSTNLQPGANTLMVTGTNSAGSDTKSTTVIYQRLEAAKRPPLIAFVAPSPFVNQSSIVPTFVYKATIQNVPNASALGVKFNGTPISNYTYDGLNLTYSATLSLGNNILEIAASNKDGSDSKSATVLYKPKEAKVPKPPVVQFTSPATSPAIVSQSVYQYVVKIQNVNNASQLTVTYNGTPVSNFQFNGATGILTYDGTLVLGGQNMLMVTATTADGTDSKSAGVIKRDPEITICHHRNDGPPETIVISESAWPAHEAHGDTKGACVQSRDTNGSGDGNNGNGTQEQPKQESNKTTGEGQTTSPQKINGEGAKPNFQTISTNPR